MVYMFRMNFLRKHLVRKVFLPSASCLTLVALAYAQNGLPPGGRPSVGSQGPLPVHETYTAEVIASGGSQFQQNCAFCHGRDAGGGESGPDLTRSKLVTQDKAGEGIGPVIRNGRLEKGMPKFNLSDAEVTSLVAFIHSQQDKAMSQTGNRKGVDPSDLQTGNAEEGKKYFNGAGTCSKCHSATGDLAGVAKRYEGLKLEQQMLYPRGAKAKVSVTPRNGKPVSGTLAFQDEFTVALLDDAGTYHSWSTSDVTFKVDAPFKAHVELFDKYTDDDIHNLMAYIQTLR
jgi:cytochrome c oxidase cbb3-type subunit III